MVDVNPSNGTWCLVTGAGGFIGAQVCWSMVAHGYRVVALDCAELANWSPLPPEVKRVQGDVGDRHILNTLFAAHGFAALAHLAGSISNVSSLEFAGEYARNNVAASRTVFEAALRYGARHIAFASSAAVYAAQRGPLSERSRVEPSTPYGESKRAAEIELGRLAQQFGGSWIALRCFNAVGADCHGRTGRVRPGLDLFSAATACALGLTPELHVFGANYPTVDGTAARDFVHVADVADAFVRAIKYLEDGGGSGVLNCASGRGVTVNAIAEEFRRQALRRFPVRISERREGDVAVSIADISLIESRLDWRPGGSEVPMMVESALNWAQSRVAVAVP